MGSEKRAIRLAQVGFGALLLCGVAQAKDNARHAEHPKLVGHWEIVPDQSDDPGKAADFLLAPSQPGEGRRPFGGRGMGGIGGGPGGYPGGRGGFGGWGRGGGGWGRGGRGGDDERTPPTETERAAMRDAIKDAVEGGSPVAIADTGAEIEFHFPESRTRRVTTDGKPLKIGRVVEKAEWKDGQLELKTETRRFKIRETWAITEAGDELFVEVHAKKSNYDGELLLKRVYRKAAETASPVEAAPLEAPSTPPESGT